MGDPDSNVLLLSDLGGLSLEAGGIPVSGAGSQPSRLALLAVIGRSGARGVSRDRLLALFWPESDLERARNALNQALYALRRDAGEQELTLGGGVLRLNPQVIESESGRFERALEEGRLEEAIAHYRGPFLEGVNPQASPEFERWADEQREHLHVRCVATLDRLARAAEVRDDRATAIAWCRQRAAAEPLNSAAALGLIEALAAGGDRAGALRHAARHIDLLKRELDLAPDSHFLTRVAGLKGGERVGSRSSEPEPRQERAPREASTPSPPAARVPGLGRTRVLIGVGLLLVGAIVVGSRLNRSPDRYVVGRATPVTAEPGLEIEPSLSPDGRFVAYAAGPLPHTRIYVRQPGGRALLVTPDSGPAQRRPQWSPDGAKLLVMLADRLENGLNYGVAVAPALGGTLRVIVPSGVESATWAPDSRRIAYVRGDSLFLGSIEDDPPRAIAAYQDMHALAWSPDGRFIAMAAGNSLYDTWGLGNFGDTAPIELLVVLADGGIPVRVAAASSLNASPVWAPDSRRLLFVSNRDGPRDVYAVRISDNGKPAGSPVRLTTGLSAHSITLSADGRRLAFSAYHEQANIWALPIRTDSVMTWADAVPITTGSQVIEAMSLSWDGRRLYYDSHHEGYSHVYRISLPDGQPVQLTHAPADEWGPAESWDGEWLAFYSRRYGNRDIMVMPARGGDPVRVTSDPAEERFPFWSPDGRLLTYGLLNASERNGRYVITRGPDGRWSEPHRVGSVCWVQDWTPDGRGFLCTDQGGTIVRFPLTGSGEAILYGPHNPQDPVATHARSLRDGHSIVFRSHDVDGRAFFWLLSVPGAKPRLLARIDDLSRPSPRAWFATDGRRLYFTIHERESDVYVVELSGLP